MIINNDNLDASEKEALVGAISDITVLIAGADGKIDSKEMEWAEKITKIRSYSVSEELKEFYQEVGKDFQEKLSSKIETLPADTEERTKILSDRLTALNAIMAKLDQYEGSVLYKSYVTFAKHVAKSSGGFLSFFSIGAKEKKFVGLPMLDPISPPEDE